MGESTGTINEKIKITKTFEINSIEEVLTLSYLNFMECVDLLHLNENLEIMVLGCSLRDCSEKHAESLVLLF